MNTFLIWFVSIVVFTVLDLFWLVKVAPKLYRKYIGHLMSDRVHLPGAAIFYVLYHIGLTVFVLIPHLEHPLVGAMYGGLFGLVMYATYDLTNLATLRDWPKTITVIDLIWGTVLTSASTLFTLLLLGVLL
jgi:uncharacterized membrane protein